MRNRHVTTFAVLLALVLGILGCAGEVRTTSSPAAASPRLAVDSESRDLGVVGLGEEAVGEFELRNTGGAPLTLSVSSRSRDSRVEGLVPELRPGESARLRFLIDTYNGDGSPVQSFTLDTNDPDRPRVVLQVELKVRPFLVARPGYARYITVQHAREGTIAQTIGATDEAEFRVLRVESPTPNLRVAFREAREDERQPWKGSQWRVMTTLDSHSPVGALSGLVVVHTDHPRQKRIFIQLSGFVRPMLAATPPEVRVGDFERQRAEPWRIFVRNFAEEAIEVTGVSTDVAAVRVELEPLEPGRSWRVKLFPVAEAPLGPFTGKILLRTASPTLPSFEIPLAGRLVESLSN
jgi:hypothetical protein